MAGEGEDFRFQAGIKDAALIGCVFSVHLAEGSFAPGMDTDNRVDWN